MQKDTRTKQLDTEKESAENAKHHTDRADQVHSTIGTLIKIGLHISPLIAVAITWSLSARAFGHTGNHLGLFAIEFSFLLVASSLTMGLIRGRAHSTAAWVSVTLLVAIIGMNCATGFYTSETGYLQPNAPSYLETWRTHALAWTPIITIFLSVIFAALDGDVQDKIGAENFDLWERSNDRKTDQITRRNSANVTRLRARADAEQSSVMARARLANARQLTRSVRRRARSSEFRKRSNDRADELLNKQSEVDAMLTKITGNG